MQDDDELIDAFVATFEKLGDLRFFEGVDPVPSELVIGDVDASGYRQWRPTPFFTDPQGLTEVYQKLPARFPPLYERLILSYRWAEVDLGRFRLLANPAGPDLGGLLAEIFADKCLGCTQGHVNLLARLCTFLNRDLVFSLEVSAT